MNKSENQQQVELQVLDFYKINSVSDIIGGEKIKVIDGKLEITVNGVGFRFLQL